jgi:hypothetical protein
MPTPRSRGTEVGAKSQLGWTTDNGYNIDNLEYLIPSTLWTIISGAGGACVRNRQVKSVIQDWVTGPGERRGFNTVQHWRSEAAWEKRKLRVSWAAPYPSMDLEYRIAALANVSYATPDVPWGSLVSELGSLVRNDLQSNAYLPVTLMEMAKTFQMIRNPFGILKTNWRDLVGLKPLKHLVKGSSIWLEGRYGWKPLVSDIGNFCDAYVTFARESNRVGLDQDNLRYSTSSTFTVPSTPNYWGEDGPTWLAYQADLVDRFGRGNTNNGWMRVAFDPMVVRAVVGCRKWLIAQRVKSRMEKAMTLLHCRPQDLFAVIWELLPYSFVFDWFVDLQGIMGLASAKELLVSSVTSQLGYSLKWSQQYSVGYIPDNFFWKYRSPYSYRDPIACSSSSDSSSKGSRSSYVRLPGLPATSIDDFCSTDLSFTNRLDAAGLIFQLVSG